MVDIKLGRHKKGKPDFIELDEEYYRDEEADEEYYELEETDEDAEYYELENVEDEEEYYESEETDGEGYYKSEEIENDGEYYEPERTEDDEVYYEAEETEAEEEYYGLEEAEAGEEYYESEETEAGEEYFEAEETEGDEAYYESEESEPDDEYYEEYYEPEESEDEYYELEEAGDGIEYYELDEESDEEYYESVEDWEEADEEEYYAEAEEDSEEGGIFSRITDFLSGLNTMDYLIAGTGVLVLIFAIAAGSMFIGSRISAGQVEAFAELGSDLEGIDIIGESGLLAVADAAKGKQEAAQLVGEGTEGEHPEQVESEAPAGSIEVGMNLSSMQQDLKIKFINKKSTKLIASVPFEVEVTDANKKTFTLTDDDMDGIIYKNGLTPGKYSVSMVKLSGETYQEYAFSSDAQQVTVKDKIEYKKVDVSDEIKTEAEVNASAEDTKVQETVESVNKDTVAFVESTKTQLGEGTYKEINKATITDPATTAKAFRTDAFLRLANVATNEVSIKKGESVGVNTSLTGDVITWLSDNEAVASVDGGMTGNMNVITGKENGTASVTASNGTDTETFQVTVTEPEPQFTLDKTSILLAVGGTETITASVPVTWTSEDPSVATVNESGVVTGVKDGTTSIVAKAQDGTSAACSVKVSSVGTTISPTKISIKVGETAVPEITVNGPDKTVVWTTSDEAVATVALNGTITGVKEGKATITATANGVSASCQVTVTGKDGSTPNPPNTNAAEDTTTALKDNRGNQVYIMNASGEYVAAVYADYYKYDKFYIKSAAYKYTGWQTIDGSVYYYDVNGNVVTGTQVIQGATYNFDSVTGALVTSSGILGIDVSKWNGNIDWNAVKNSGINYVIIRCGYRGSSTGALIEDPKFRANIKGATAAGLKVGIYFFTQAVNEVEAVEEASMVLSLISGYTISYPVFLDVEPSGGRADGIGTDTRTAVCNAFCQTISNSGYAAGIYANKTWLNEKINAGGIGGSYKVWLAQYAATPSYGGRYQMWQYTSQGKVAGIQGNVDMNLSYLGY